MTCTEIRGALEEALGMGIYGIEFRPSAYRSSYRLDELDVHLEDGSTLALVRKDLSRSALDESVRAVKPEFLYEPMREIETYRAILPPGSLGTATYYATLVDPGGDRYWLFLERVDGVGLWQVGDFSIWETAARWLRRMHTGISSPPSSADYLLRYDAEFYGGWLERARLAERSLERIAVRYGEVVERLLALPTTFVHGEFYASNVLVGSDGGLRICPVDWEMAGIGPSVIDLAALASGRWTDDQRTLLATAYLGGVPPAEFLVDLDCCLLHLAVQWVGWSQVWSPPPEHAYDWIGEANRLAGKLGL